ncbi:YgdI/YgdR family lipoprotein [Suttonella sp. R2A3]|uniref:YgdI/YgdR family lipoprotein n=1 Tax=Suttonella sp. R2A3 TaxID=2908648 RepID=UPI001F4542D3|nr:YgdI/YgdR family lipoprotein [Suttonella sp. R2A3]UJF24511.1 YgdI/YgdR family lipoprotein [Suttonella sp. R2A3]
MRVALLCSMALLLGACGFIKTQSLYEVRMTSGERLYADNRPSLDDGYYTFYDVNDQKYIIRENLVLFIEPAKFKK